MEQVVLEIKNLSKVYESKGASVKALTDVSLTVNQGETIGIVLNPDDIHIMRKSQYSDMFGDYSSYSEEYEEISDASFDPEGEDSGDEE